jgi:hypothetical protein
MRLPSHPDRCDQPVALVAEERPEAPLLLLNRQARAMRLSTGMRFGAAKSLVPELRAGSVSDVEVEENTTGSDELAACAVRSLATTRVMCSPEDAFDVRYPLVFRRQQ